MTGGDERNVDADLAAVRREAHWRMIGGAWAHQPPLKYYDDPQLEAITKVHAAKLAEVKKRTWQRWEHEGRLPRAALERFWRRVDEAVVAAKGKASLT